MKGARYSKVVLISIELVEYINVLAFNNRCRRIWEIWRNHSKDRTRILTWSEKVILISQQPCLRSRTKAPCARGEGGMGGGGSLSEIYNLFTSIHRLSTCLFFHINLLRANSCLRIFHTFHPRHLLYFTKSFFTTFFFLENISLVNCDFFV